jgi:hypothetical protein
LNEEFGIALVAENARHALNKVFFQIALPDAQAFRRGEGRQFPKPRSGGFPEGLIDRAFYTRV